MKASTIFHLAVVFISSFLIFCLAAPLPGQVQESGYAESSAPFSREELAQMLAPIALYPDTLLSQVLMASTYPIEVVEADRWVKRNPHLKGENLDAALLAEDWDPSVKALCHFPTVLALMSKRIGETTNIGNAFLAQEEDVMNMIRELRARAYEQGNLKSSPEQKIIVEKQTIIIEPADPRVIYVPYYDPLYIYGPWWYPAYPPYYWGPSRVSIGVGISYWRPGFFFGFAFGTWSYFDWHRHYIYINVHKRPRFVRHDKWITKPGRWHHVSRHRRGVAYRDKFTARKYGQYPRRFRKFDRSIRGFPGRRDRDRREEDRTRIDRDRQGRERIERDRQARQRADRERRKRERIERKKQARQGADRDRQMRQRADRERQRRERVDRNVFNRVDEGRRERESSARGRMSRGGRRGDDSRGRSRGDGGGRDDRSRRGR